MPDTDEIHQLFRSEEDFESFLASVNDQGRFYELFTAVERTGIETYRALEQETIDEIDHFILGWMRLLWEAHDVASNMDVPQQEISEDPSWSDLLFQAH